MDVGKRITPAVSLVMGLLLVIPLILMNVMAGLDMPSFDWFFRDVFTLGGFRTNPLGSLIILICILLLPLGAGILLMPTLQSGAAGKRRIYPVHLVLAILIFAGFVLFVGVLAEEIYRCDVLQIPNCD